MRLKASDLPPEFRHLVKKQAKPKGPNKTEQRYAAEVLEPRRLAGEIKAYWYERCKWKIAGGKCWLTIDYLVQRADGLLESHEVKARWSNGQVGRDDSRIKLKCLAEQSPFKVVLAVWGKGWEMQELA